MAHADPHPAAGQWRWVYAPTAAHEPNHRKVHLARVQVTDWADRVDDAAADVALQVHLVRAKTYGIAQDGDEVYAVVEDGGPVVVHDSEVLEELPT